MSYVHFLISALSLCNCLHAHTRVLETFEVNVQKSPVDQGWKGGAGRGDFTFTKEGDRIFLRSNYQPPAEAKYLYKAFEWDTEKLPYLRWQWRVNRFPLGASITDPKRSDAGAQLYLLWGGLGKKAWVIKYFWSASDPVGTVLKQSNILAGTLFGEVIRSAGPTGVWQTETRNVFEDFRKGFDAPPPSKTRAIAFLSDGDETRSETSADLGTVEALESLPVEPPPLEVKPHAETEATDLTTASKKQNSKRGKKK